MRNLNLLDRYRITDNWWIKAQLGARGGDDKNGAFVIPSASDIGEPLRVMASADGEGWDHVSVSCERRCPTWYEMEQVKRLFFKDDEVAMQLHVPPADHINCHPHVLHLWRPTRGPQIPRPPQFLVGAGPS
jgi:hypothetical protein